MVTTAKTEKRGGISILNNGYQVFPSLSYDFSRKPNKLETHSPRLENQEKLKRPIYLCEF